MNKEKERMNEDRLIKKREINESNTVLSIRISGIEFRYFSESCFLTNPSGIFEVLYNSSGVRQTVRSICYRCSVMYMCCFPSALVAFFEFPGFHISLYNLAKQSTYMARFRTIKHDAMFASCGIVTYHTATLLIDEAGRFGADYCDAQPNVSFTYKRYTVLWSE
jgi:hypothetical protein